MRDFLKTCRGECTPSSSGLLCQSSCFSIQLYAKRLHVAMSSCAHVYLLGNSINESQFFGVVTVHLQESFEAGSIWLGSFVSYSQLQDGKELLSINGKRLSPVTRVSDRTAYGEKGFGYFMRLGRLPQQLLCHTQEAKRATLNKEGAVPFWGRCPGSLQQPPKAVVLNRWVVSPLGVGLPFTRAV